MSQGISAAVGGAGAVRRCGRARRIVAGRFAGAALLAALLVGAPAIATAQDGEKPPEGGASDAPTPPKVPLPGAPGGPPAGPPPGSPETVSGREATWPAPTAEDWRKPVLLTFQRTWEDALAVSKETQRPILVCVNMDGEIASEHYAGVRYRDPEIAPLYAPYVCVIASVYRHTPRDFDEEGRRVPCPRFGSVTCGEHIAIEPILFEKFFEGRRIAPRHVMVELDGTETYDVFYANDTASVFRTIREGMEQRPVQPPPLTRGDRPVVERVASPDVRDRVAVESAYAAGDAAERKALLEAALAQKGAAPLDLLRLAVFGLDADLAKSARKTLAEAESPAAAELISEALRVPLEEGEREALLAALERLGAKSTRAQWLAVVHRGLSAKSDAVDVQGWSKTLEKDGAAEGAATAWYDLEARRRSNDEARRANPEDPEAFLGLAETSLALGRDTQNRISVDPKTARNLARLLFEDARRAAVRATELGGGGWRADTVLALAAYYDDRLEEAYSRAELAVKALPAGEPGWNSMAVLTVFAESRWKAIQKAVREKERWPPEWLADVNAAYSVLRRHPLGRDAQVVWHYDFLAWLGARRQSAGVLQEGVARFPESAPLHERMRERMLRDRGPDGLEAAYADLTRPEDAAPALTRFAGYASLVAAEFHRRAQRPDSAEKARESYARAISHYERAIAASPEDRGVADRYVALALAGRARLALEAGEDEAAVRDVVASLERSPGTAGTADGLGITPGETAQMLRSRLVGGGKTELAGVLDAALATIDPDLLRPKNE